MTPQWAIDDYVAACRKPYWLRDLADHIIIAAMLRTHHHHGRRRRHEFITDTQII